MKPSKEYIDNFKKIYQEEYHESISDSDAFEMLMNLANLLRTIIMGSECNSGNNKSYPRAFCKEIKNDKLKE
jgi:hypothetical protein